HLTSGTQEGTPIDRPQEAIDRRALLGAARQVHAAQQCASVHAGTAEHLRDELVEHVLQRRELLREAEDPGAPPRLALILQAPPHALVEPRDEQIELIPEELRRLAAQSLLVREGDAPDLLALLRRQVIEVLGEA